MIRDVARQFVLSYLEKIPGLPAKAGQILRNGLDVDSSAERHSPKPISIADAEAIIAEQAPQLSRDLVELDPVAIPASLGQVHRGKLKSGEAVAIKVQYPGIRGQLEGQIDFLIRTMERFGPQKRFGFNGSVYRKYLLEEIGKELEYKKEAVAQTRFRSLWASDSRIVVPEVLLPYCSDTLLVQRYEPAMPLRQTVALANPDRENCANHLVYLLLASLFRTHLLHADFHPGNWGYRSESGGQIVLYDFGSVIELDRERSIVLEQFALGAGSENPKALARQFIRLGFDPEKIERIEGKLVALCSVLFEPFRAGGAWDSSQWNLSERLTQILDEDRWWFRTSGPPWFLNFMRAANGFVHMLRKLDVKVPVAEVLEKVLSERAMDAIPIQTPFRRDRAEFLHVEVREGKEEVVSVRLPAHTAESLEELIPEDVRREMIRLGHDIQAIQKRVLATNFAPQVLFEAQLGARTYRVYLG